jgi:hypothetical protein
LPEPKVIFGASSALISLKMLGYQNIVAGFGKQRIKKYWHPWFERNRNWHEANLKRVLRKIEPIQ